MKRKHVLHRHVPHSVFFSVITLQLLIIGMLIYTNQQDELKKERDAERLATIGIIEDQLRTYAQSHHTYPACLYSTPGCVSLEDAKFNVPRDPWTRAEFSYAAFGKGNSCTAYHIGIALERTGSQALLTGADAPPKSDADLCFGSKHDFSGLSYTKGGMPCDTSVGTPQPTTDQNGETCYDVARRRLP